MTNGETPPIERSTGLGEAWPAVRMALPSGVDVPVAIFSVATPLQRSWIQGLRNPPVSINLPAVDFIGDLNGFLSSVAQRNSDYPMVRCTIEYTPNNAMPQALSKSVTALHKPETLLPAHLFWKWSSTFADQPPTRNLLKEFPGLGEYATSLDSTDRRQQALRQLESAPCGVVMGKGRPASGLTTFAIDIAHATVMGPSTRSELLPNVPLRKPKVVWLGHDRRSVDKAVRELTQRCDTKTVCHVLSLDAELRNLKSAVARAPKIMDETACIHDMERELVTMRNEEKRLAFKETCPSQCPSSLSEYGKQIAQKHDGKWEGYHQTLSQPVRNPTPAKFGNEQGLDVFEDLLSTAADSCDVLCGTPEALAELSQLCQGALCPDLVVMNDATQISEGRTAIAFAHFPKAAFLLIGDTSQLAPAALVSHRYEKFRIACLSIYQRSLFTRANALGKINFELLADQGEDDS